MDSHFRNYLAAPIVTLIFFLSLGLVFWLIDRQFALLTMFLYIGIFTAGGMTLYAVLPSKQKRLGRLLSLFMVGGALLIGMGIFGRVNAQLEGFFFDILAGVTAGTVTHYLVAKILGVLVLQRSWCGWGCWSLMVFNLLPYRKSEGWLPGKWPRLRYAHFALSLGLVLLLWYGFGYSIHRQNWDVRGLYWFLAGNAFYYLVGIGLALSLKDNRAFCKYVCPLPTLMKPFSAFSLLRIKGDKRLCNECGACAKTCPFNIDIAEYTQAGQRVLSTECVMCLKCVSACPKHALKSSFAPKLRLD